MSSTQTINKTLEWSDLRAPQIQPTVSSLNRWTWHWLLTGERLAVNGYARRRAYIRRHKMWEYARGLALTGASAPVRRGRDPMAILDVGGAMTAPLFYLAGQGDRVVSLDIDAALADETNRAARHRQLQVEARTIDLAHENPTLADLGVEEGFDRIYCFSVIEHIPPPGQTRLAGRLPGLLKPGGQMCLTFDYGHDAPTGAPLRNAADVDALCERVGLPLCGDPGFVDTGLRYALNRRHPGRRYTFGSLFFHRTE
ncbi:MAG: class I SAM-dependent methyltransferase [Planctomycetota bacterium]|jgi:protein-L-isoaspartate O-methyltransferase